MRFAQAGWVALAFLLSAIATGYYILDWPRPAFRECWNGYFLIPPEDWGMHTRSDLKDCRETSAAEGIKGNVRAAELAASLYGGDDEKKNLFFLRRAVELGSGRSKSILAKHLEYDGLKNCPEILGLIRSYRPSGKYPDAEKMDGLQLADITKECEEHLAATKVK
ncbi:MAG: hypothetical protein ABI240_09920 [Sphingomonas sp.]